MVSCAVDVADPNSSVSAGRTGRYRSIEIGPKTVSRLSTTARARPTVCWRVVGAVRRVLAELTGVLHVGERAWHRQRAVCREIPGNPWSRVPGRAGLSGFWQAPPTPSGRP